MSNIGYHSIRIILIATKMEITINKTFFSDLDSQYCFVEFNLDFKSTTLELISKYKLEKMRTMLFLRLTVESAW